MSELINKTYRQSIRLDLLATASTIALLGFFCRPVGAHAADDGAPTVWIEFGGQLSRLESGQQAFAPPLFDARPSIFDSSQPFERSARYSVDETGKISVQPGSLGLVFSGSVRYGRSTGAKDVHQQTHPHPFTKYPPNYPSEKPVAWPVAQKFAETNARADESHLIVDFQVGKEVGLGMFGNGSSVLNLGVRFAQFANKSSISLKSNPDWHFHYKYLSYPSLGYNHFKIANGQAYHSNAATLHASRNFHGVGPSISWNASAHVARNPEASELDFDWGMNAALLFGRQRTIVDHEVTGRYHGPTYAPGSRIVVYHPAPIHSDRVKTVIVPNVGGFAGLSFRYSAAKVSFGYRADFFLGAMDGGIDVRKTYDRNFYGPFATVSIGLGG